jgi:branched-chain amino acid transport system substrate-binding protein
MIQNDGIKALFGSSTSATAAAEEALAGQSKLPMMIFAGNDISLTTTNFNAYSFQLQPSTYMEPRAVAQYLAKSRPARIFTISPDYSFGHSYVSNFMAGLKENGVEATLVGEQYPPLASTDYTSYISAALAAKPDFVFVACSSATSSPSGEGLWPV